MKDIFLVLGSNSFTGSHFVNHLINKGHKVYCISRSKEQKKYFLGYSQYRNSKYYKFYKLDLNKNLNQIIQIIKKKKPNFIINFSSQSMVAQSWLEPLDWYKTNVVSSINFVEMLKNFKFIKKFVQVSTPEVYGSTKDKLIENTFYNPSTPYAISRACFDNHLYALYKNFKFPVVFTRAANVYGPGQRLYRIIPATIYSSYFKKNIKLDGGGASKRSFIYVTDVVEATYRITLKGKPGEIFHISTKNLISIKNLVKNIFLIMNGNFKKNVKISKDRIGKDKIYHLDCRKIKKDLNWTPKVNLKDGLKKTIEWFIKYNNELKIESRKYIHIK